MTPEFNYNVFFDLDRTLLKVNSGKPLIRQAYRENLLRRKNLIDAVYLSLLHRFHLQDTTQIASQMPKWLKGISEKKLADICTDLVHRKLIALIRPEIAEEIDWHRKNKARLVILSAAIPYICKPLADYLRFDDIICSEMEVINGIFTGIPKGNLCLNNEKSSRLIEYCKTKNCILANDYYYGDSYDDIPVMTLVGHPVCVNPDKKLSETARGNGWPIRAWE